jgi:hypothetical protein
MGFSFSPKAFVKNIVGSGKSVVSNTSGSVVNAAGNTYGSLGNETVAQVLPYAALLNPDGRKNVVSFWGGVASPFVGQYLGQDGQALFEAGVQRFGADGQPLPPEASSGSEGSGGGFSGGPFMMAQPSKPFPAWALPAAIVAGVAGLLVVVLRLRR